MDDSEGRKSAREDYESDADEVSTLRWTARRMEASDDDGLDDMEEVRERHRRSAIGFDGESDGLGGAPEYDNELSDEDELEEATVIVDVELEELSQEEYDEGARQDMVLVNQRKKKIERKEGFVPRSAWFYMHDDRFQARSSNRSRGAIIELKSSNCTEEQKWMHDKFEAMGQQETLDNSLMHPYKNCYMLNNNDFAFSKLHCLKW
ncbi:hypothetical protein L6164_007988 [Bauhinia variegata]|uniref:Uncharacterized protein n=1 Tax=Bauhinia variegata TaxID=167791 RepID=A0ACB9PI58_BAUVA|nr:hypothetical protein L6164_007988 [Bauhinia variegata]